MCCVGDFYCTVGTTTHTYMYDCALYCTYMMVRMYIHMYIKSIKPAVLVCVTGPNYMAHHRLFSISTQCIEILRDHPYTVIQEVFMFKKFWVINCVEIFSWSEATMKLYYHEICSHTVRKWRIKKGIFVFVAFMCIAASTPCWEAYLPMLARSLGL